MVSKTTFIKLLIYTISLFLAAHVQGQSENSEPKQITDGIEYWELSDEELFRYLKKKYRMEYKEKRNFVLKEALSENIILVRLISHENKIAALKRARKNKAAQKLIKSDRQKNKDLVDGFLDFYDLGQFYFYYPKDARSIFMEGDYSLLMLDEKTPIKTIPEIDKTYLLKYESLTPSSGPSLHLYHWEQTEKKMIRMKKYRFGRYKKWQSQIDLYESIRYFREVILK